MELLGIWKGCTTKWLSSSTKTAQAPPITAAVRRDHGERLGRCPP
ncbi:UNVERIFIED_CONTAM: hypothetical protein RKD43_004976 [Streptomyces graminofaciens]